MKRLAKYLHILNERFPAKKRRLGLALFCFLWMLWCLRVMFFPVADVVKITPIRQLKVYPRLSGPSKSNALILEDAISKIQQFRQMVNDSNINVSPGLMDSLSFLEVIYQSQKNDD